MILLKVLISFLFICSFCNAQDGHNFSVKEIDSIIETKNLFEETASLHKSYFGIEFSGISFDGYHTYNPTGNNDKELIKGTHTEYFIHGKYSQESNMELYFNKGELFFVKLSIKKYKGKRLKKIKSESYEYNVVYKEINSDIIPDDIKEWIENKSIEILESYNSAKYEN